MHFMVYSRDGGFEYELQCPFLMVPIPCINMSGHFCVHRENIRKQESSAVLQVFQQAKQLPASSFVYSRCSTAYVLFIC